MSRQKTDTPAPSTLRVRLHRQRRQLLKQFEALLLVTPQESMFTITEMLEAAELERIAYSN